MSERKILPPTSESSAATASGNLRRSSGSDRPVSLRAAKRNLTFRPSTRVRARVCRCGQLQGTDNSANPQESMNELKEIRWHTKAQMRH